MLTVTLMLSGPHRLAMLETAFDSIPIESDAISQVMIRHQGGRWNWGGPLRERILAHPKVRLVEFPDRVDWAESYNRTLAKVDTPWTLMLPDDDFLIRPIAKVSIERALREAGDCGLIAFGWHFLKDGRYLATRPYKPQLSALIRHTPKMCSTLMNTEHSKRLGGFAGVGGFIDTELFGRLTYEYDTTLVSSHVGVYRLHDGQESARLATTYGPYVNSLRDALLPYARTPEERLNFERTLKSFVWPHESSLLKRMRELTYSLRSLQQPAPDAEEFRMRKWSDR